MSSIDSVQQIVATIRAQMTARVSAAEPPRTPSAEARPPKTPKIDGAEQQQQRMSNLIGQRVKALDPDDPKRGRKAFRIFLESVLLAEFGESLINDPAFYQMIDDVQQTMEQDPQISETINKAVASLLGTQPGGK
jgi:hypothetical protein